MNRKNIIISISIIIIVSMIIITIMKNDKEIKKIINSSSNYLISIDGASSSSFPEKGAYDVNIECTNATGEWNYEDWNLEIYNTTGVPVCNINFTTREKQNLANYIIELSRKAIETDEGTIYEVANEKGYRYEGSNPKNYIWFNNELWRIIGVFDSDAHGVSTGSVGNITSVNLTKIIRNDSIGNIIYDLDENNDWQRSDLFRLLVSNFYNSADASNGGTCYQYKNIIQGNCNYEKNGINAEYRRMVRNGATWNVGGGTASSTPLNIYTSERSGARLTAGFATLTNISVGLMYASDYGYSSKCARTTTLDSYDTATCAGTSWLKKYAREWTMDLDSSSSSTKVLYINYSGKVASSSATNGYAVRPVVYLHENVELIGGDGSIYNPYRITYSGSGSSGGGGTGGGTVTS